MSTAALALAAAVAALVTAGIVAAMVLRTRRTAERRVNQVLLGISEQMDALADELSAAVEKVRDDAARARIVESLGQALDLDEVLARCAEAATSINGVAGATIAVRVDGAPVSASAGLAAGTRDTAGAGGVSGPPDGSRVRAVGISYHYPVGVVEPTAMRSAIAVPVESEGGHLGFLTVFGHGEAPPVEGSDFQTLEAIVRQAGPAIEAARLRGSLRLPAADALTGLANREALHETLALEVARAHRHGRRLAVCVFDLDDFKRTNGHVGNSAGDDLLVELAELLRVTLQPAGLAFRSGGDEFAVILPGAGRIDAEGLYASVQATLSRPGSLRPGLSLSAGIAELKPDDDGVSLFERAERALRHAKESGKGTAA